MQKKFPYFVALIAAVLLWLTAFSSLRAEAFAEGLAAWDAGDPAAAARAFQLSLDQQGPSAATFYNMALALEQQGDALGALVSLLRARALDTASPAVQTALQQLLQAQGWSLPPVPNWMQVARHLGLSTLYVAGAVVAWLGICALVLGGLRRRGRGGWLFLGAVGVLMGGFLIGWAAVADPLLQEKDWAVVQAEANTSLLAVRVSPVETAQVVEKVRPGEILQERTRRAGWSFCRLASGQEGWLPTQNLLRILPEAS